MIRQAISCDICGAEKKQTNHWFVAWEHAGELRLTGWSSRNRLRAGSKHLCGQACFHKLADEFLERTIARRSQTVLPGEMEQAPPKPTDTSLIAHPVDDEFESSARLVSAASISTPAKQAQRPAAALVSMPQRMQPESPTAQPPEPIRYGSRSWHAEAWERERERAMQSPERTETRPRRASQA